MDYKTVYPCWVIDEVKNGKVVFVLDKLLMKVAVVNEMRLDDVIRITENGEENRYEFWHVEETKTEETEENKDD